MNTALQLFSRKPPSPLSYDRSHLHLISSRDLQSEQESEQARLHIFALQAEIRSLRAELAHALHALNSTQTLLRNAKQREHELRAELVKGIF